MDHGGDGDRPVAKSNPGEHHDHLWLKRQAIQVAAQLPEDRDQALAVLTYAQALVTGFLGDSTVLAEKHPNNPLGFHIVKRD
jgi:hypothetical protein